MNVYFHVAGIMYALLLHFFGHVAQFFELNSVGWGGVGVIFITGRLQLKETSGEEKQIKEKRMRQNLKLPLFLGLITGCVCQAIKQIIKQQLKRERE